MVTGLGLSLSQFGLQRIFIKEYIQGTTEGAEFITIRLITSFIFFLIAILYVQIQYNEFYTLLPMLTVIILGSFEIIEWKAKALQKGKCIALARVIMVIFCFSTKYILITYNLTSIIIISISVFLDYVVFFLSLYIIYKCSNLKTDQIKSKKVQLKATFLQALPVAISTIVYLIYRRIDSFILLDIAGSEEFAVYSLAIRILDGLMLSIVVIDLGIFPVLSRKFSNEKNHLSFIYYSSILFYSSIIISIIMTPVIYLIVEFYLPKDYSALFNVYIILSCTFISCAISTVRNPYLLLNGGQSVLIITSITTLIITILTTVFLVNQFGIIGAATASFISQFIGGILLNYFFKATKNLPKLQLKSISPYTLIQAINFYFPKQANNNCK